MKKMSKKLMTCCFLLGLVALAGCDKLCKKGEGDITLSNEDDKTFYSIGVNFGAKLTTMHLSEKELNILLQGVRDSGLGNKPQVDPKEYQSKISALLQKKMKMAAEVNKKSGKEFLDNFVKNEGGKVTESGLAYKVLQEGTGDSPKATDVVKVHYKGTLIDGTTFDSSYDRKKEVDFPLNRVIKGWTEGIQLAKVGGKIKLVIPSELAYGEFGAPPKIPAGATLVFEVELLDIVKKEEAKNADSAKKEESKKVAKKK